VIKSISVYCGSAEGFDQIYHNESFRLGQLLAKKNIGLIFGGGRIGLMGAVADGVLKEGGKVTGVIPGFLMTKEVAHNGLTEMITVESMHERKLKMLELSDGAIVLPGGYGTMDEMFEMLTWGQLSLHKKPVGIYNMGNFYDTLYSHIQQMYLKGFLNESNLKMLLISADIEELLKQMNEYIPPERDKRILNNNS
jgi:uncharacterized protein (TIGR00730 family)